MKFNITDFKELFKDFPLGSQANHSNPLLLARFNTADKLNIWLISEYDPDKREFCGIWFKAENQQELKDGGYTLDPFNFPVLELEKWVKEYADDVQVIRDSKFKPTRWFDLKNIRFHLEDFKKIPYETR